MLEDPLKHVEIQVGTYNIGSHDKRLSVFAHLVIDIRPCISTVLEPDTNDSISLVFLDVLTRLLCILRSTGILCYVMRDNWHTCRVL